MISLIERFTPWRTLPLLPPNAATRERFDWRTRRAVELIHSEPHVARDVATLAREVGLSRPHFYLRGSFKISRRMITLIANYYLLLHPSRHYR